MEPIFSFWSILFLTSSIQGLLLSIFIWRKQHQANRFLALAILAFSLMLGYYVCYWTGYARILPRSLGMLQGMTYLIAPCLYGYITSDQRHQLLNWKHFIAVTMYPFYFLSVPELLPDQSWIFTIQNGIQSAHLLIYAGFALHMSKRQSIIAYLFFGYALSFLAYYILVWTNWLEVEYDYFISLFSTSFIYSIGYLGYNPANIFRVSTSKKYDRSGLSQNAAESILKAIRKYMVIEKGFLDNDLKLHKLSEELSISSNHISQVINELEGCNFHNFVNKYRVEEAKKLLKSESERYKIIQIAYLAGFNNKATFNSAFKKFVGIPPSQFKKNREMWSH